MESSHVKMILKIFTSVLLLLLFYALLCSAVCVFLFLFFGDNFD